MLTRLRWLALLVGLPFLVAGADAPSGGLPNIDLNKIIELLLGPAGLAMLALLDVYAFLGDKVQTTKRSDAQKAEIIAVWQNALTTSNAQWQQRFDLMKADRDEAIVLAKASADGYKAVTEAIGARNRLESLHLRELRTQQAQPQPPRLINPPDPPRSPRPRKRL